MLRVAHTSRRAAAIALCASLLAVSTAAAQCPDSLRQPAREGNVVEDFIGFTRAFASDGWAVATSPFRLEGRALHQAAGVVGAGALLFAFDEPIQDAIRASRDEPGFHEIERVGEFFDPLALMGKTNKYWAGGILLGYLTERDRVKRIFQELLFSHWLASITRKGIGRPIGRFRPFADEGAYHFEFLHGDGTSFPSGHASTITQVATVLAHHIDWWPADALLYGMAASVVYQRVSSDAHWASDSWIGAAWGYGVARIVIARRECNRSDFVPIFDPATGAVGLRVTVPF